MNKSIQITKEGKKALEIELAQLRDAKRPKLVERLSRARAEGDLSENSDYQNAKDELEFLDGRISELAEVLKNAVVADRRGKVGEVSIGAKVYLKSNGKEITYHVVGEWEANPAEQKISHSSPLGLALVGKKKGDKVQVEAPAGTVTYKILKVE